jgi:hypothetical protein
MKRIIFSTVLFVLLFPYAGRTQDKPDPTWYDRYYNNPFSMYKYIEIAEKVGWVPRTDGKLKGRSLKQFEDAFISVCSEQDVLKSMQMTGTYYCALNHDFLFERYNKNYKPVTRAIWDEYCPILYILMQSDIN